MVYWYFRHTKFRQHASLFAQKFYNWLISLHSKII